MIQTLDLGSDLSTFEHYYGLVVGISDDWHNTTLRDWSSLNKMEQQAVVKSMCNAAIEQMNIFHGGTMYCAHDFAQLVYANVKCDGLINILNAPSTTTRLPQFNHEDKLLHFTVIRSANFYSIKVFGGTFDIEFAPDIDEAAKEVAQNDSIIESFTKNLRFATPLFCDECFAVLQIDNNETIVDISLFINYDEANIFAGTLTKFPKFIRKFDIIER